jgi:hypothetical protein
VVGVILNIMGYLNVCARFDRIAAEAVRVEATSPSYGFYGTDIRAQHVRDLIQAQLDAENNSFRLETAVSANSSSNGSGSPVQGLSFSMLSRIETFDCSVTYYPWPFDSFAGLSFFALTHQRHYSVDPYRPGVLM